MASSHKAEAQPDHAIELDETTVVKVVRTTEVCLT